MPPKWLSYLELWQVACWFRTICCFLSALMALMASLASMVGPLDWKVSIPGEHLRETSPPLSQDCFKLNALAPELLRPYLEEHNADSASTNGKQMAPTRIGQSSPHFVSPTKKGLLQDPARMGPRPPADRPTKASSESSDQVIPLALAHCGHQCLSYTAFWQLNHTTGLAL